MLRENERYDYGKRYSLDTFTQFTHTAVRVTKLVSQIVLVEKIITIKAKSHPLIFHDTASAWLNEYEL